MADKGRLSFEKRQREIKKKNGRKRSKADRFVNGQVER